MRHTLVAVTVAVTVIMRHTLVAVASCSDIATHVATCVIASDVTVSDNASHASCSD